MEQSNSTLTLKEQEEMIKYFENEMYTNKFNNDGSMMIRSMSSVNLNDAIMKAKQYPGYYICSCYGSSLTRGKCNGKVIINSDKQIVSIIECSNGGDSGIEVLKALNKEGYSVYPNEE